MRGWSQFAADVEQVRLINGAHWIATSSYATTGQLAFQFKSGPPVVQLTERLRYAHLPPPDDSVLRSPAIYVEHERRQAPSMLREHFGSVADLGKLTRSYRGTSLATYVIYRVADPTGPALQP
jgi:hypothetical protein